MYAKWLIHISQLVADTLVYTQIKNRDFFPLGGVNMVLKPGPQHVYH